MEKTQSESAKNLREKKGISFSGYKQMYEIFEYYFPHTKIGSCVDKVHFFVEFFSLFTFFHYFMVCLRFLLLLPLFIAHVTFSINLIG